MYLPRIRTKTPPHPLGIPEGLNCKTYCRAIFKNLLTLYLPRSRTKTPPHPLRNPEGLNCKTYCRAICEKRIALYLPRIRTKTPPHPLGIPEALNWRTYCRAVSEKESPCIHHGAAQTPPVSAWNSRPSRMHRTSFSRTVVYIFSGICHCASTLSASTSPPCSPPVPGAASNWALRPTLPELFVHAWRRQAWTKSLNRPRPTPALLSRRGKKWGSLGGCSVRRCLCWAARFCFFSFRTSPLADR